MLPRPVVAVVVLVLTGGVAFDLAAQSFIPGHTANPLVIGPLLAVIGAVLAGQKGPKPDDGKTDDSAPPEQTPGRHRNPQDPT